MTAPTLDSFFSGGGGKSVSWKDKPLGTTVTGTIKQVHPPQQQTDPVDNKPQFKKDGVTPKMSVRIDLATNERDPQDPEDDGSRGLYVQGWMQGAIGEAVRKTGHQGAPEVGGQLSVTLTERTPNDNPALAPINKFSAVYVRPQQAAAGQFFDQGTQQAAQGYPQQAPAQQYPQQQQYPAQQPAQQQYPPQGYPQQPQQQYAPQQQPPVQQYQQPPSGQVPNVQQLMQPPAQSPYPQQPQQPQTVGVVADGPLAAGEPPRPESIDPNAWAAMDLSTKQAVANTLGTPPF